MAAGLARPVLVTGATGGVGSVAVDLLAQQGYTVAASTGKTDQHDYLRQLGASQILSREEVSLTGDRLRPLLPGTWAGAVDTVGGATLSYLLRTVNYGGNIALCGLVGGHDFAGTVIPFLLRGINLLGIDSVACPMAYRQTIWQRLATDLKPRHLGQIAQVITLRDLPGAIAAILKGQAKGRLLVAPSLTSEYYEAAWRHLRAPVRRSLEPFGACSANSAPTMAYRPLRSLFSPRAPVLW